METTTKALEKVERRARPRPSSRLSTRAARINYRGTVIVSERQQYASLFVETAARRSHDVRCEKKKEDTW